MIVLRNVQKSFGAKMILDDVSLRIDPGEFLCIFGRSGSGKTTLMSLMLGETHPTTGTVEIDGADLSRVPKEALQMYRRRVGVMFQDGKLLPHSTVRENISLPLEIWGAPEAWLRSRTEELLSLLDLEECAEEFPPTLSAGERAKVALARAMAAKPLILFADEPTGNLDLSEAANVIHVLQNLQKEGTTVIFATHDEALLEFLNARVVGLEQGNIVTERAAGAQTAKAPNAKEKHEVFTEEAVEGRGPLASDTSGTNDSDSDGNGKRKVHITSINS